jgi:hypothetical protein
VREVVSLAGRSQRRSYLCQPTCPSGKRTRTFHLQRCLSQANTSHGRHISFTNISAAQRAPVGAAWRRDRKYAMPGKGTRSLTSAATSSSKMTPSISSDSSAKIPPTVKAQMSPVGVRSATAQFRPGDQGQQRPGADSYTARSGRLTACSCQIPKLTVRRLGRARSVPQQARTAVIHRY